MQQKSADKMHKYATLFHALLLLHHTFVSIYVRETITFDSSMEAEIADVENYRWRYLTSWNMCLQSLYLTIALYTDVVNLIKRTGDNRNRLFAKIESILDYLFTSLVLPTGLLVCGFFWIVFNIDRELVYPSHLDVFIPSWLNHSMHTTILALPFIEVVFRKATPSFTSALKGMTIFSVIYNLTYLFTYYQSSRWLYKIFDRLTWFERSALFATLYLAGVLLLWMGMNVQRIVKDKKYREVTSHIVVLKKLL